MRLHRLHKHIDSITVTVISIRTYTNGSGSLIRGGSRSNTNMCVCQVERERYIYIPDFRIDTDVAHQLKSANPNGYTKGRKQRINLLSPTYPHGVVILAS